MARSHGPGDAFERRRGEVERVSKAGPQYEKVSGEIQMPDVGETSISVNFPVFFVDKPSFSWGAELYPGSPVEITNLPTASCVVLLWHTRVRDDGTSIYVGAQFALVATGPASQVTIFQWHVEGVALRGPVDED